ncbi:MAG: hypothetical protein PVF68_15540, partial [Acidobacteriota bacterium]
MQVGRPAGKRRRGAGRWIAAVLTASVGLAGLLVLAASAEGGEGGPAGTLSLVCWALVIAGIGGTALASCGRCAGWLLLLGLQPIWIAYAICTDQPGLVLGSLAYGVAQLNGLLVSW